MGALPTLMALTEHTHTPMVPTTTARGLLTPTPTTIRPLLTTIILPVHYSKLLAPTPTPTDSDTEADTDTEPTTDKPSAVLIALFSVVKMSSHHPHHTKYPSHYC